MKFIISILCQFVLIEKKISFERERARKEIMFHDFKITHLLIKSQTTILNRKITNLNGYFKQKQTNLDRIESKILKLSK